VRHQLDFLSQIIDINPHFIFVKDRELRFMLVNEAVAEAYGTTVEDLIGKTDADFNANTEEVEWFRRDDLEVMDTLREKFIPEEVITDAQGRVRYLQTIKRPLLDANGEGKWLLGVATDITALKQAEEERRSLEAQVQHAQKLESLGVLAGGIAHDFNNLLVGIMANVDILHRSLDASSQGTMPLEHIRVAANRAADLCSQMLAYSGRGHFVLEPVRLNNVIRELRDLLDASISKKADVDYQLSELVPPVDADPTQIRQIVMNLIVNASESLEERSGSIRIATDTLVAEHGVADTSTAERVPAGTYVTLEVTDTGVGMTPEQIKRAFDPFYSSKTTGRGLGLAVVQGIIRGHRGAIQVESKRGEGTTFRILLPAGTRAEQPGMQNPPQDETGALPERVLVVDDEPIVLAAIRDALLLEGVDVITAHDGDDALNVLRGGGLVSGVLLDLTMPQKSGDEVLREIRAIRAELPVVVMSGYDHDDLMERFRDAPPTGFLKKPFASDALLAAVRKMGASAL
jgi:PAS domain S-box-containing protein